MDSPIPFLNWKAELDKPTTKALTVGDDILLFDDYKVPPLCYEPFKLDFAMVWLVKKGGVAFALGSRVFEVSAPSLVVLQPSVSRRVIKEPENVEKKLLALSKNITDILFSNTEERLLLNRTFFLNPVFPLSEKQYQTFLHYFSIIEREIKDTDNLQVNQTVACLLRVLLSKYPITDTAKEIERNGEHNRKKLLSQNFYIVLHTFSKKERSIDFYAHELSVSPQYLSKAIKEATGKSVGKWIDDYVIDDLKVSLRSKEKSIQKVSEEYHFDTMDALGKYFKRHTGMAPSEYRKKYGL